MGQIAKKLILSLFATFAVLSVFGANAVYADNDFIVYSPHVVQGQREVEMRGFGYQDGRSDLNGAGGYNISIAHAVTSWWKPEIYIGEFNRAAGGSIYSSGYEFENTFQLGAQGEYWADVGFLASYVDSTQPGISSIAEFGPLLEKMSGHVDQRLNLIFGKQTGGGASSAIFIRTRLPILQASKPIIVPVTTLTKLDRYFPGNSEQMGVMNWNIALARFLVLIPALRPEHFWPVWGMNFSKSSLCS